MARACEEHGVSFRTDSPVVRVFVSSGRATGVQLQDGLSFKADVVAANVNPHLLFKQMVDAAGLPGLHVASKFCQHFAYTLPDGKT